jgi:hypothetical protein
MGGEVAMRYALKDDAPVPGLTHDGIVNDPATYKVVARW